MWTKTNSEIDLINGVLKHGPEILDHCLTHNNIEQYLSRVFQEKLDYPTPKKEIDTAFWFIPNEYKNFDIEKYCLDCCQNQDETDRVVQELQLYKEHNMMPVLQCMKYIVDTLRKNNVLWGVGRGSSVASYCLFLIGVHKINSIKYQIPLEEFFR
jgi:DNA polymerase III alpha subunit